MVPDAVRIPLPKHKSKNGKKMLDDQDISETIDGKKISMRWKDMKIGILFTQRMMAMARRPHNDNRTKRDALREQMFKKQSGFCHLCGKPMSLDRNYQSAKGQPGPHFATFDHLIPRKSGGKARKSNLLLAHRKCNSRRNHDPLKWADVDPGPQRPYNPST